MKKEEQVIKVEDVENSKNSVILDVPDYVYISKKGKLYYPQKTAAATTRIRIEDADAKGYKPSRGYQKMVEKLYKEHQESKK